MSNGFQEIGIRFLTPLVIAQAPGAGPAAVFTFQTGNYKSTGEHMSNTMQIGTIATVSVEWKDAGGNTVGVEQGTVQWDSSDTTIATVTVSTGNPQIANVYAQQQIGTVEIHATGDADLGQGITTVTATCDIEVIAGQAVSGDITFTQSPGQGNPPSRQNQPRARK